MQKPQMKGKIKNLSPDYLLTASSSHVYYSAHVRITVDKNRNGLAHKASAFSVLSGNLTAWLKDPSSAGPGATVGSNIKLSAEAGRSSYLALLNRPSGKLWAFCEVESCCHPREMFWLWGQSGPLHAAMQQGGGLVLLTLAQESSPGWSLFEDSPSVAATGRDRYMKQVSCPFWIFRNPLGMFP